jgi:hypothetical protein
MRSLMTGLRPSKTPFLFLHAFIASILHPLWFYFEPPQLQSFNIDGVRVRIRLSPLLRIRNPDPTSQNGADPCETGSATLCKNRHFFKLVHKNWRIWTWQSTSSSVSRKIKSQGSGALSECMDKRNYQVQVIICKKSQCINCEPVFLKLR